MSKHREQVTPLASQHVEEAGMQSARRQVDDEARSIAAVGQSAEARRLLPH